MNANSINETYCKQKNEYPILGMPAENIVFLTWRVKSLGDSLKEASSKISNLKEKENQSKEKIKELKLKIRELEAKTVMPTSQKWKS